MWRQPFCPDSDISLTNIQSGDLPESITKGTKGLRFYYFEIV